MKKLLAIVALATASVAVFAQGYYDFASNPRLIWNDTNGLATSPAANTSFDVAFLVSSSYSSQGLETLLDGTPTNGTANVSLSAAWADILSGAGGYVLATNEAAATGPAVISSSATGGFSYNGGQPFEAAGVAAGVTNYVIIISWATEGVYTTPALAAAADAPLGWSTVTGIYAGSSATDQGVKTFTSAGPQPFGVVGAVPEPSTIALAGMGVASLLAFRRRK